MIVVGGEALVDLVPENERTESGLAALVPRLGGAACNVAVALGRLGADAALLSRLSTDAFGRALLRRLSSSGVDTSLLQRGDEPTSLAVVNPVENGVEYTFHVHGCADRRVVDPGPLESAHAVSLGGLSLVLEPGASAYESVMRRESHRGSLIALDPNIRDPLIDDAAAYRARFENWLPNVDLLKLSAEDAQWLVGDSARDPVGAAREWVTMGPSAVLVTHGGAGMSVVLRDGGRVDVSVPSSTVVDTIGAGDTVQAAVLAWLARNDVLSGSAVAALGTEQWRAVLRFAASSAAVTCSRPGAEPPHAAELDELASC
ncbi:carbohydrate kinase [Actinopolyspora erythraea]|uniref:Carbohydrate kinase n=1 Tax=Actinopolyspora erythraea TaxID=414996 RepID=A0A099D5E1_9ACTN|nr:carbohydrate kinase [Actinopolyspora erythraea]ASU81086.1 carbohydrate kinase [Actinopolyspora erythraea]KGI81161.1 sugar kinase [Actinopolyspora erythraea]